MNFLTDLQMVFNNREIALLLWIAAIALIALLSKFRNSLISIFKNLTSKMFLIIYSLTGAYLFGIIFLFKQLDVWKTSNLKDVLFWLFSVGLILVFKINDAKSNAYFKSIFMSAFKWTILLEFIVNLYSFSLLIEIIILPVLVFIVMIQASVELNDRSKVFSNVLQNVITLAGFSIFIFSLYKTVINFNTVFSFRNIITFLIPSTITISFIPFLYFLALYSNYESYFIHLDFMTIKKDKVKEVKKLIFKIANFNLNKLLRIRKNFEKSVFYEDVDLKDYVKSISKKAYSKNVLYVN